VWPLGVYKHTYICHTSLYDSSCVLYVRYKMEIFGALLFCFSVAFHTSLLLAGKHLLDHRFSAFTSSKNLWSAANWLVSIIQALLATSVGLIAVNLTNSDVLYTRVQFFKPYAWFSLGYWTYDLVCLFILVSQEAENSGGRNTGLLRKMVNFVHWWPGIVFHHLGIIVFLYLGIIETSRVRGDGIIGFSLLMELSSIFVALRSLLGKLELKATLMYLVVSLSMVFTFFLCRILLLPYVVMLYCRQAELGLIQGVLALPTSCKVGTLSFYTLNMYWFSLMLKGCVKAVRRKDLKDE